MNSKKKYLKNIIKNAQHVSKEHGHSKWIVHPQFYGTLEVTLKHEYGIVGSQL